MKANSQGLRKQVSLSATNDKSNHGYPHISNHKPTQEHITTLKGMHALVSKKTSIVTSLRSNNTSTIEPKFSQVACSDERVWVLCAQHPCLSLQILNEHRLGLHTPTGVV
jgi:hypothetical protein